MFSYSNWLTYIAYITSAANQLVCCQPSRQYPEHRAHRAGLELSDLLQNISQVPRVAPSMRCHVPRQIFPTRTCVTAVSIFNSLLVPGREVGGRPSLSPSPGVRTVIIIIIQISWYFPIWIHQSPAQPRPCRPSLIPWYIWSRLALSDFFTGLLSACPELISHLSGLYN